MPNLAVDRPRVQIIDNVVEGFQKTGIVASGNVDVTIRGNSIGASSAQRSAGAANGIQVGAGARALDRGQRRRTATHGGGDDAAGTAICCRTRPPARSCAAT